MSLNGFGKSLLTLSLVSTLAIAAPSAYSASACKGLDESACHQTPSCSWVSGYKTKNGNSVSAYCRSTGSKAKQGLNSKEEKGKQSSATDRAASGVQTIAINLEEKNG